MFAKKTVWLGILGFVVLSIAAAVNTQISAQGINTQDFNPDTPSDHPDLTEIDVDIEGIGDFGVIYMIEGIENSTSVEIDTPFEVTPISSRYERLVIHGVFSDEMRDWRQDVIDGNVRNRDIDINVRNSGNRQVLTIEFFECVPVRFALPPFATDGSTRYIERMEFVYETFDIRDN